MKVWATRLVGLSTLLATLVLVPPAGRCEMLDLYGSLKTGWVGGGGSADQLDYFDLERGPALGLELGAEILFIDVMVNATRMFDQRANEEAGVKGGGSGTLFQFLLGIDGDFAIDGLERPSTFLRLGLNGGLGLGLHRDVRPPLDNSQVSAKGFMGNAVVALDHHLNRFFVVGVEASPGYHYFLPGGASPNQGINDADNQSHGFHFMGLAFVQVHLAPLTWGEKRSARRSERHQFEPLGNRAPAPAAAHPEDEEPLEP